MGGPFFFGAEGWRLVPGHFAERHGLIIIIALGESIVAIGVGADVELIDAGVIIAAVLGIVLAAALWWLYFDVVALVAARRLARARRGREQNELARDSYSYLHFPMVAGHRARCARAQEDARHTSSDPLDLLPAVALLGGVALYLLGPRRLPLPRHPHVNRQRLVLALALFALIPAALELPALATLGARDRAHLGDDRLRDDEIRRPAGSRSPPGLRPRTAPAQPARATDRVAAS